VTRMGSFPKLFDEHNNANIATLWDIHTDDKIPSRAYRRVHYGEE
jgi:acetolactate synthase-1/2/3 large subunit